MAKRKLKRIEIIILVGFISSVLTFMFFWWGNKKTNRDFYLPQGYEGWVMIHYGESGADALPLVEETQQIRVPSDGLLETSTPLEIGWRRDRFFWLSPNGDTIPIPSLVDGDAGGKIYLHQRQFFSRSYMDLAAEMPSGSDTTLADGTEISKLGSGYLNYKPGTKSLEYFYLSAEPQPLQFNPPPNPRSQALESLDSREIKIEE